VTPPADYSFQIGMSDTYDPKNKVAEQEYGKIKNHTSRLDTHWSPVGTQVLASRTSQLIFNTKDANKYTYNDLERHLIFSKYPVIQVRVTSTPSSNATLRITQLPVPLTSPIPINEILQLPGHEFDLKSGDCKLQPYWNHETAGLFTDSGLPEVAFQVDVIGGVIGTEPVYISMFVNSSPIEYFHLRAKPDTVTTGADYQYQIGEPMEVDEQGKDQMSSSSDPQIETNIARMNIDSSHAAATSSERRWQFVDSLAIAPTTGLVSIKLTKAILGKHFLRHVQRYHYIRGTPRVRITFTNAKLTNANVHIVHNTYSPGTALTVKPHDWLTDAAYSLTGAAGPSVEIDLKWRVLEAYMAIDDFDMGYLHIVIPQSSAADSTVQVGQNLICTIQVDTSNMELRVPSVPSSDLQELEISSVARATPALY